VRQARCNRARHIVERPVWVIQGKNDSWFCHYGKGGENYFRFCLDIAVSKAFKDNLKCGNLLSG
jgi:hypothetical protein